MLLCAAMSYPTFERSMHFFIDENIPYAEAFFSDLGEITRFSGRELTPEQLTDADVLLVRSITQVNDTLLQGANKLKFVGTATIGEDHIDKVALQQRNIAFSSAPGCNAVSVAEYVISALFVLAERHNFTLLNKTVGIVGVGNIGKALKAKLEAMGITLLLCDPPRQDIEHSQEDEFVELNELLAKADIITCHTPKTKTGPHPTHHLLNQDNLALLKQDVVLINASRGEVIDNQALLTEVQRRETAGEMAIKLVLDVWENEPNPLAELVDYCDIATAHIAGYSLEGKARGTEMLYQQVCELMQIEATVTLAELLPNNPIDLSNVTTLPSVESELKTLMHLIYDVRRDDALFRNLLGVKGFDWLRKNYPVRREWSSVPLASLSALAPELPSSEQKGINFLQLGFDI